MTTLYAVACLDDYMLYTCATRRFFATRAGAQRYAATVAAWREPVVFATRADWHPGAVMHEHYDAMAALYGATP